MANPTRRGFLEGLSSLVGLAALDALGCDASPAPPSPPAPALSGPWTELHFAASDGLPKGERALVYAPPKGATWPTLVALHGRGETRSLEAGARGWRDDYGVDRVIGRLGHPPLTKDDLLGFVSDARLAALNASLAKSAFQGLQLVTPYTPDLPPGPAAAAPFSAFVSDTLLPAVGAKTGVLPARASTGIDGVSLGGRLALLIGFARPDVFASVGALQPAIDAGQAEGIAALAKAAQARQKQQIRIVTSTGDYFREAVFALGKALEKAGVEHEMAEVEGPHDYAFNRGPGAVEMLLFHERVLRGLPSP